MALNNIRWSLLFVVLLVSGCGGPSTGEEGVSTAFESRRVTVERVVDGDTIKIRPAIDGIEDVRLIGIDTPEKLGSYGQEPLAEAATNFTGSKLRDGRGRIQLRFDIQKTDQYGRLLAYIYTNDGAMLNEDLVRTGYAQAADFPPNTRHREDFDNAQDEARDREVGIWGLPADQACELRDRGNGISGGC